MFHERVPEIRDDVRLAPGRVGGRVGVSSKFGTGSGNCVKTEERRIRTGISKKIGRVGYVNPGSEYITKFGIRRGLLPFGVAATLHRRPYTDVPLPGRLARHIPRELERRHAFPGKMQTRI